MTTMETQGYSTLTRVRRDGVHRTLEGLAAELARMQATKIDYVVDSRLMSFATGDDGSSLTFDAAAGTAGSVVNDYAHGQIAARTGIPKKYYDRMRQEAPVLLDRNVLHWLHDAGERRLVRMLDGRVRAFLSDRYRRLDNFDLMERAVIPALRDVDGLQFQVASLTPERMVLRAILPSVQREIGLQVGDIVQAGFQLRNSEVGSTALSVEPFVWKLDCLNGLVSNAAKVRAYHVGRRIADSEDTLIDYRDDTIAAADKATFLMCRDAIRQALSESVFGEIVEQIRAAADSEQVRTPVAATQQLAATFGLNEGERDSVLMSLARGGVFSRWGVVNAVTDAAKHADTFDRQEEMERLGGELLTMAPHEWRKIAAAA